MPMLQPAVAPLPRPAVPARKRIQIPGPRIAKKQKTVVIEDVDDDSGSGESNYDLHFVKRDPGVLQG